MPGIEVSGGAGAAGHFYAELVREQLDAARASKSSIEQRGIAVITTSAAAGGLLFGFSAFATASSTFELGAAARVLLILAVALFVAAAMTAIATNIPRTYEESDPAGLRARLEDRYWDRPADAGRWQSTENRLRMLEVAQRANSTKARALTLGIRLEVAGLGIVGLAIGALFLGW